MRVQKPASIVLLSLSAACWNTVQGDGVDAAADQAVVASPEAGMRSTDGPAAEARGAADTGTPVPVIDATASDATTTARDAADASAAKDGSGTSQALVSSVASGVTARAVTINQGTAIGEGAANGATPSTLTNVGQDPMNTESVVSAVNPFLAKGTVPDTAAGFCDYSGAAPQRISYVTGDAFEKSMTDPMVPMAPFYFPLVYTTTKTTTGNAFGGQAPIIGLFDWRPKDLDEAVVAAESDDDGQTWYFMQSVLELFQTRPIRAAAGTARARPTPVAPAA